MAKDTQHIDEAELLAMMKKHEPRRGPKCNICKLLASDEPWQPKVKWIVDNFERSTQAAACKAIEELTGCAPFDSQTLGRHHRQHVERVA